MRSISDDSSFCKNVINAVYNVIAFLFLIILSDCIYLYYFLLYFIIYLYHMRYIIIFLYLYFYNLFS